jgi:hypothetical protein
MLIKHACGHEADIIDPMFGGEWQKKHKCDACRRLEQVTIQLGCAMARSFIHSEAGVEGAA